MHRLTLKVEAPIGMGITDEVIREMRRLADMLDVNVTADLNGIPATATPGMPVEIVKRAWQCLSGTHPDLQPFEGYGDED